MWKRSLSSVACFIAMSLVASAASPETPWGGFYAGLNAGYAQADAELGLRPYGLWLTAPFDSVDAPWVASNGSPALHPSGGTLGAQIGYNWQRNRLVYGLEADLAYTDLSRSRDTGILVAPISAEQVRFLESARSDWFASIRPRIGYANGNWLIYGTGGLAIADFRFTSGYILNDGFSTFVTTGSRSQTPTGWVLGAGVEIATGSRWNIKAEYLYADFGRVGSFSANEVPPGGPITISTYNAEHSAKLTMNLFRVGLNYRF